MKKLIIIVSVLAIIGGVILGGYGYFGGKKSPEYDFSIAFKGGVVQEVSVTGRVEPAKAVEIAFEKSGRVSSIYAKVGQKVSAGQILTRLENNELLAQLLQAEANLEAEKIKLTELEKGARPEEIQSAQTKTDNAKRSLEDALINLKNVKNKAEVDLDDAYKNALTTAQKSASIGKNALLTLTDIQTAHFADLSQNSLRIEETKAQAVLTLLGAQNAGRWQNEFLSALNGGAFGLIQEAINNHKRENIDKALQEIISGLREVKQAIQAVPASPKLTLTEKTDLSTEENNINTEIAVISQKQGNIETEKAVNINNIASAEMNFNQAKRSLATAEDDLILKKAGVREEEILSQKARIKSSQAALKNIQAQIDKTILRAPINGLVTKRDAEVGEIISANAPIISLISEAEFQIKANVAEADITKVKTGKDAKITLDAYGRDIIFEAKVNAIDPAETIIEGVTTYKTTLQFIQKDERIKSGMTANIDILSEKRVDVIVTPQRAVIKKDSGEFIRILEDENIKEIPVKTGLRGSDGNIEIIKGINQGDKVITFIGE